MQDEYVGGDQPFVVGSSGPGRASGIWVAALIVAGVLTVGMLVGALALTTASSNRSGSLELVLERFATPENPVPSTMTVGLDGVVQDVVWQGDVATIEFRDAFSTADEATVSLTVPERVEFPVAQPAEKVDGVPRVVVRITDDTVVVEGTDETFPRANPAGEARRIEAERQRAEAERLRAVHADAAIRLERAVSAYDSMWERQDLVSEDEVKWVVWNQVLPELDSAIWLLRNTSTDDESGMVELAQARTCVGAIRPFFEWETLPSDTRGSTAPTTDLTSCAPLYLDASGFGPD